MSPATAAKKKRTFDPERFLSSTDGGGKIVLVLEKATIFAQGDPSDAVFYIQNGEVKLTVLSRSGKEAIMAVLNEGGFFGEGCLAGQSLRMCSATATTDCSVMRIDKQTMKEVLRQEQTFSDLFVAHLLTRTIRYQEDLADQIFNSSEKRLARILLLLAGIGNDDKTEGVIPNISQETLAEMVGTTRSRINFFLNKFRKLGLIDYNGEVQVRSSLLNIILQP